MGKREIENWFPQLTETDYTITSPETPEYNCIAWAACDSEAWWWPDPFNIAFWPSDIPREETLEAFIKAYNALRYVLCNTHDYEEGFEKIALYEKNGKPSHAARQLNNGRWTSKLGKLEDIEHTLEGLYGQEYGSLAIVMKRAKC